MLVYLQTPEYIRNQNISFIFASSSNCLLQKNKGKENKSILVKKTFEIEHPSMQILFRVKASSSLLLRLHNFVFLFCLKSLQFNPESICCGLDSCYQSFHIYNTKLLITSVLNMLIITQ